MMIPTGLTDIVSNLLTGVVGNRFSRRLSKRSLSVYGGEHRIKKRIVNVQPNVDFFGEQQEQQNTLISLEEPFTFPNGGNRLNDASFALKFPKEHAQLTQINQSGNNISPSDVRRLLKSLFPEASAHLSFDNDQLNRELLKALVNERIGKILTGVQSPALVTSSNNFNSDINRNRYQNFRPAYAGGSNYNQKQQDRSQLVYVTNSRGQIEYTLNEVTGEKQRIL